MSHHRGMARGVMKCCAAPRMMMKCAAAPSHEEYTFGGGIFDDNSKYKK